jgi:glutamate N-acetyltransferase/amino-acid N-acetyltransferase
MLAELAPGTTVAGVFTRSLTASAPVLWCREALKGGSARFLVVNSGNSNAFTGRAGVASVKRTVDKAAAVIGCKPEEVFVASTGTIGVPLDDSKITAVLADGVAKLADDQWNQVARAILTTDTYPKTATRTAKIGGTSVRINGFCKGAGMIAPDMATMLAYVFTDAAIPAPVLQDLLAAGTAKSFNAITVDSDTSTSDTLMLFATGKACNPAISSAKDPALRAFKKALDDLLLDLALQVVKDGEGASKFVEIRVTGAASARAARTIGMSIANSPLVKTAVAGEDANWGRIVMAVGKSGEKADRDTLSISIGGVQVAKDGQIAEGYDEAPVTAHMKGTDILFEVDIGVGRGKATVWTCDLTHAYIDINGSYRT